VAAAWTGYDDIKVESKWEKINTHVVRQNQEEVSPSLLFGMQRVPVKNQSFPGVWFDVGMRNVMDRVGTSNAKEVDRESGRQGHVT
jgi:hypothetical protein